MRSPATATKSMGGCLYTLLFRHFPSVFNRQEVGYLLHTMYRAFS